MDGDLTLNESHAIVAYLANKYSSNNEIYPTDPSIRAKVDQMMYFDTNLLSKTFGEIVVRDSLLGILIEFDVLIYIQKLNLWFYMNSIDFYSERRCKSSLK